MSGLILKDMYVLVKQLRVFLFTTPLLMLSGELAAMFLIMMLFAVLPMTAMGYDEQSKWTNYATMMPYAKSDLVVSKYILGYILIFVAVVFSVLVDLILNIVQIGNISPILDYNNLLFCVSGALIFLALNMFVNFKFGVEKGRIIYILFFIIIGALNGMLKTIDQNNIMRILETPPIVFLLISIIMNVLSIILSIKFRNKE